MKTLKTLLIIIFCISICFSCSEESDEFFEETPPELKSAKIKVYPSTNPIAIEKAEEDWNNINTALQSAGPGDVVQLAEGLFYLHKSIVRWDFNGTLKGAGVGKTTIQTIPGELFDVSDCPPLIWSFEEHDGFFMLCFAHHYFEGERTVTVSDLSVIVDQPTTPYYKNKTSPNPIRANWLQAVHVQYENLDNDLANPVNLNVNYKNLSVTGEYDPGKYWNDGYSLMAALVAFGASSGTFEAKNVHVETAGMAIMTHVFNGPNSSVILKNCHTNKNNRGLHSFLCRCWVIQNCDFENSVTSIGLSRTRGIVGLEMPEGTTLIKDNRLNMSGGVAIGAGDMGVTEVKDNVIYGFGLAGMWVIRGNSWSIKDNDFCGVVNPWFGHTIHLVMPKNFEVKDNYNQSIGGVGLGDESNIFGEGRECGK